MFDKWRQWQEDAALDSKLEAMRKRRKNHRLNMICLNHVKERLLLDLAVINGHIAKEQVMYHTIDRDLAEIDGRKSNILEEIKFFKREDDIKKIVKKLGPEQRKKLLEMLKEQNL